MTEKKIEIGPICGYSLSVVVKREDCPIWERNTSQALPPTIITIFILVDVVSKMNNVVHGVLTSYELEVSIDR